MERCVSAHRGCLREPEDPEILEPAAPPQILELPEHTGISANRPAHRFTDRLQECHAAVHAELATGASMRAVARKLGLGRNTVHKYARAATWQEMFHGQWQDRTSILDPHREYLLQRWSEGCHNALALHRELQTRGYQGSYGLLRDFARQRLRGLPVPIRPAPPAPPTVRQATGWIVGHPDGLDEDAHRRLKAVLDRCPELAAVHGHVHGFARMLTQLQGVDLPSWMAAVRADHLPGLDSFVHGLEIDLAAVTAGLTLPFSSGAVEGNVNRIKMLKRQMFGRAGFALLRKRVLLAG
ncbi:transposase [Streptacidiphilus sp. PAMC 29251]